jgi:hypothetical protein
MSRGIPAYFKRHAISIEQGRLSKYDGLAGTPEEVEKIFLEDIPAETKTWKKKRVVLYAHGGLVPKEGAIKDIEGDIGKLIEDECYLVGFIWRTGPFETIASILEGMLEDISGIDAAVADDTDKLQKTIEKLCGSPPLRKMWSEMKENAELASKPNGAMPVVFDAICKMLAKHEDIELHLIGHSAGAIFHAHAIDYISSNSTKAREIKFETCTLWAPACTSELFSVTFVPMLENGGINRFNLFTLTDSAEQDDTAWVYPKSLLYLVSNAFEEGPNNSIPLTGMSKFALVDPHLKALLESSKATWTQTSNDTHLKCSKHGDFSGSLDILTATVSLIHG